MGRGHGATRGSGAASGGGCFDFAREKTILKSGLLSQWDKEGYEATMSSIDRNIKDPQLKAEMKAVVDKMHNEMGGLPGSGRTGIKVEISNTAGFRKLGGSGFEYGVHTDGYVALNGRYFGHGYTKAENFMKGEMAKGNMTTVSKPALKTFAHELGHGYYDRLSPGGKAQVAKVFSDFTSSKSTKGWGSYAKKSATEFYADAVAKSVLGGSDRWTKALGSIR